MSDTPQQVSDLLPEDLNNLERAREWVKGHFTELAEEKYAPIDGKLRVLDAVLNSKWVEPQETDKLQSLGVAFGDAIAQKLLMEWIVVEDEYGRSAALVWPGTSLICSPITMISKRIEDGEDVDVYALFDGICERLKELAFSGRYV
jgi:Domain of unknown function (DUF3806)